MAAIAIPVRTGKEIAILINHHQIHESGNKSGKSSISDNNPDRDEIRGTGNY
jgi:hypothetical protein